MNMKKCDRCGKMYDPAITDHVVDNSDLCDKCHESYSAWWEEGR